MTIIYIAGPMTGHPDYNYPAFFEAEARLVARGFGVRNPARHEPPVPDPQWADFMRLGIKAVCDSDAVALLPDWAASQGATLERRIALALGLPVKDLAEWIAMRGGVSA